MTKKKIFAMKVIKIFQKYKGRYSDENFTRPTKIEKKSKRQ